MPRKMIDPKLARDVAKALMCTRVKNRPPTDADWHAAYALLQQTSRKKRRGDLSAAQERDLIDFMEVHIDGGKKIEEAAQLAIEAKSGILRKPPLMLPGNKTRLLTITDRWPLEVDAIITLYHKHRLPRELRGRPTKKP